MKAYVMRSGVSISPFNDPAGEAVRVLGQRLKDRQAEVLSRLGMETVWVSDLSQVPVGESLVLMDNVFFTRRAILLFIRAARKVSGNVVLALPDSAFCREKRPLQEDLIVETGDDGRDRYVFNIFLLRSQAATMQELREGARRVAIALKEKVIRPPNLEILGVTEIMDISYAFTRQAVMHICHWSHILDAHLQALFEFWLDVNCRKALSYLWRLLTAFSLNKWKIARRLVYKGRKCDIHPTAVVEASVLGDRVMIGPHAVVRGSVIGSNVKVDEHAEVMFSAVGDNCICAWRSRVNFSVLYPRSLVSYPAVQTCVVGEGAVHTGGAYPIDMKLDFLNQNAEVPVLHHGKVVGSGKQFLGVCFGHRSVIGTGQWLTCGLEVPNGAFLVRDSLDVIKRVPEDVPTGAPMALRDGKVISLAGSEEGPGRKKQE